MEEGFEEGNVSSGKRNSLIWAMISLAALALVGGAYYLVKSQQKVEEQVLIPIADLNTDQIVGNYTAKGGDGKIGTADIIYDNEDGCYVVTVYGTSAPIQATMTVNGESVSAWPLGEGTAVYDTTTGTITINLVKEGNRCDLKKYL